MEGFEEVERCLRSGWFGTGWRDGLDNRRLECRHWIRWHGIRCAGPRGGSLECRHRVRTSRAVLAITLGLGSLPPGRAIAPAATSPSPASTAAAATIPPTPADPLATGAAARAASSSGHARRVGLARRAGSHVRNSSGRVGARCFFLSLGLPTAKPILCIQNKIDTKASYGMQV